MFYCHMKHSDIGRSMVVWQCPLKSLWPLCLPVHWSIHWSICRSVTKFSEDWIISFFWYCTWLSLTMISSDWRSQISEEKFYHPKFVLETRFLPFSQVWCIRFFFLFLFKHKHIYNRHINEIKKSLKLRYI